MRKSLARVVLLAGVLVAASMPGFSQSLPRFGVGAKVSSLGIGIDAATAVTKRSNIRGGFNFLGYRRDFSKDGFDYGATLQLRSVDVHYDWYVGGFHLSPGLMVYNGNRVESTVSLVGGLGYS